MKLYVYDHCPFCVKAQAIFGLKDLPFELVVMANDDAATPERMIGRKMAPILENDGRYTPESMDIVRAVDAMTEPRVLVGPTNPDVARWIEEGSETLYRLAMPRWAAAPLAEFATDEARAFFTANKEKAIGPFAGRLAETEALVAAANAHLRQLEPLVRSPEAVNGELSEDDIHLFAHLRAMSIVRDVSYPPAVDAYRRRMSERTGVPLHDDIAA
ncbi:glutaredoxin 2 [Aurantimonas sp. 22II-16-19i]|uniref:glutaredoxin 2 n=1 Tax=Aurantimonas sp. 22II-16-19i TaxID=1317114 RepID=UPI0009F7B683|nr:glutaredoxin 2 [Aurantimonas sp. 22II-16-19i]ORE93305.1 glutaredoxin 2 [Aurantimonas sp. 22II-16-19i]